ncbi:MAG: penicillin-insensitive murein endopeptidase [Thermoleophilia bacterium]|nr:penicillin-insensitive murein endopeptidase [Thermoleophilia bacterium]
MVLPLTRLALAVAAVLVAVPGNADARLDDGTRRPPEARPAAAEAVDRAPRRAPRRPAVVWRESRPLGVPWAGRLLRGVLLPRDGAHFYTWNPVHRRSPNPAWRRYGTDRLVRLVLAVVAAHRRAHPGAPRVGVGDLSRTHGGDFGPRWGGIGHATHQNGLDVDVYYPRLDRRERPPDHPAEIDRRLAQDLVDRFVRAGATKVFVGPSTGLRGPPGVVSVLPAYHDNHMHVRIAPASRIRTVGLGRSHRGRPIRAWRAGTPGSERKALVVGCIHGNECAGIAVARRLLALARRAPVDLWIVPDLNPDGHARRTRQNARGVDLNRNFPVGWRARGRPWDPEYPGPRPLSERESRIAARLVERVRPDLTIWYHQPQRNVRIRGRSAAAARRYARLVGLPFRPLPTPSGAATAWQHRRFPNAVAFVVELPPGPLSRAAATRHARAALRLACPRCSRPAT